MGQPQRRSMAQQFTTPTTEEPGGMRQALPDPVALIPTATPTRQTVRNRDWDKEHHGLTVRGIPLDLRKSIKDLAKELSCSADVIAQVFLEYAFACMDRGDLRISPELHRGRRVVSARWEETQEHNSKPKQRNKKQEDLWKMMAHYRLTRKVISRTKKLSEDKDVGHGRLIAYLLNYSLNAYEQGKFNIVANEN